MNVIQTEEQLFWPIRCITGESLRVRLEEREGERQEWMILCLAQGQAAITNPTWERTFLSVNFTCVLFPSLLAFGFNRFTPQAYKINGQRIVSSSSLSNFWRHFNFERTKEKEEVKKKIIIIKHFRVVAAIPDRLPSLCFSVFGWTGREAVRWRFTSLSLKRKRLNFLRRLPSSRWHRVETCGPRL